MPEQSSASADVTTNYKAFAFMPKISLFFLLFLLTSCINAGNIRPMMPIQDGEFAIMCRTIQHSLMAKGLMDQDGTWYNSSKSLAALTTASTADAGKTLLDKLSPAFRFPGVTPNTLPATFAGMLSPSSEVSHVGPVCTIVQGLDTITLSLLALADWNGDGKDDWLVLCRISPELLPNLRREYYLAITDLESPVFIPEVIAISDCRNSFCHPLKVVNGELKGNVLLQESNATEILQGQEAVVEPPKKQGKDSQNSKPALRKDLHEEILSN